MNDLFERLAAPFPPERVARFTAKIEPELNSGCWLWSGAQHKQGYGQFWHNGKSWKAHRFAYVLAKGSLNPEQDVLHRCDTPSCVNPDHLRAGTTSDNMRDMFSKGRCTRAGEKNSRAKITAFQAGYIVGLADAGLSTAEIAGRADLSTSQVRRIVRGDGWSHL